MNFKNLPRPWDSHYGERSMRALEFLRQSGFRKLRNLRGGIDAWSREVDPEVPRY